MIDLFSSIDLWIGFFLGFLVAVIFGVFCDLRATAKRLAAEPRTGHSNAPYHSLEGSK